ncbi:hypothetical protein RchiOBHm_Chr7g0235861 [Rosa chinensis]|uniref:Uncharacterized protein n=1 Tax=Rosa chinensis TaxID=74649 RepID=A0A2P6PGS3_ROSCH|nr:hypothetical protein RchiOBHm_Chr7g0235861 [Rosa chinensis]
MYEAKFTALATDSTILHYQTRLSTKVDLLGFGRKLLEKYLNITSWRL